MKASAVARWVLLGAGLATLVACFVAGPAATLAGALAAALFPPALMLLPERGSRAPVWILLLAASLAAGLSIVVLWHGSTRVGGLPQASWWAAFLLAVVPYALILYGVVLRDPSR